MYLKEIFTIKVKYAKICIPGHATAHVSGCSGIQTQRARPLQYNIRKWRVCGPHKAIRIEWITARLNHQITMFPNLFSLNLVLTCQESPAGAFGLTFG